MPAITVRMAETEADFAAARCLCAEWLDWHWQNFPAGGPREGNPLDPATFQVVIDTLEQIHARPRGAVLLAEVDGQARGCVMYHEAGATTAEVKCLFVNESGRGHGLGRLLLEKMFSSMAEDGYKDVMFSSARFLTHARRLYESVGFRDMASPEGLPDEIARFIYFMERPLA